jgi:hypothetical protein
MSTDIVISDRAKLPATYKAARQALSECSRIDECQEWADKAQALASYARQAKDETLRRLAERIQARASRRCGELLKQVPTAQGARTDLGTVATRSEMAEEAGLSERQRKTALRVAAIPEEEFEAAIESDNPLTLTQLAEIGTASVPKSTDPDLSAIRKFARFCGHTNATQLAKEIVSRETQQELRALVGEIDSWLDQFITSL